MTYRETIRKAVSEIEGKFVRQSGGKGQYGHVVLSLEPLEPGQWLQVLKMPPKAAWCRANIFLQW